MNRSLQQSTVVRLFSQIKGQRIRLAVVAVSIVLYVGLSIYTPMYSALVIDHLWQSIQAAWKASPFPLHGPTWAGNWYSSAPSISSPGSFTICSPG